MAGGLPPVIRTCFDQLSKLTAGLRVILSKYTQASSTFSSVLLLDKNIIAYIRKICFQWHTIGVEGKYNNWKLTHQIELGSD